MRRLLLVTLALGLLASCVPARTYTPAEIAAMRRAEEQRVFRYCTLGLSDYRRAKAVGGGSFSGGYFIGFYESQCRGVTLP